MSICLPLSEFTAIEKGKRLELVNDCTIVSETSRDKIECFYVDTQSDPQLVYLPKYYMEDHQFPTPEKSYPPISTQETSFKLREYQLEVEREVDALMKTYQSIILSLHCGWGKSYFGILYALKLGLKTLVTVYRVSHLDQWKDSIKAVNKNLKVQILENKTEKKPDMDFYLILGENLSHRPCQEFSEIGTFIVDECHMFCTPSMSKSFMRVQPKYSLALSATPFRTDRLDKILSLHFGYGIIKRKLYRNFNVYQLNTKMKPESRETERGQLDWSFVIDSQATNPKRNQLIVRICQFFSNRTIMILSKRVENQGKILYDMLKQRGESVDIYTGTKKTYEKDARILVTTFSKSGVGFDAPQLDMLILAGDVEEMFEQYMGRVFRRLDTVPIIVDLVDNFHVMKKHFNTRMITYLSSGGRIVPFESAFPECLDMSFPLGKR